VNRNLGALLRWTAGDRLLQMSGLFAGSSIVQAALAFVTALVVARGLGPDGFGRWIVYLVLAGAVQAALDLGFGTLLTRAAARGDPSVPHLLGGALSARLGMFAAVSLVVLTAGPRVAPSAEPAALRAALLLAGAGLLFASFAAVLRARPATLAVAAAIETAGSLALCVAAWWVVERGGGAAHLLVSAAALQCAQVVAAIVVCRRRPSGHLLVWTRPGGLPALLRLATPFALSGVIANAQLRLAPLMLASLSGPVEVASFGVAARIGALARVLPNALFGGALPLLADGAGPGEVAVLRLRIDRAIVFFAVAAGGTVALCAGWMVRLAFGPQYLDAVPAVVWIAVGLAPSLVNGGRKVQLFASNRERVVAKWGAVTLAAQVLGCLLLVPGFGAAGAAAALAAGEALAWWPLRASLTDRSAEPALDTGDHTGLLSSQHRVR
jgi:O-antigen/teichoic acid export membrane protein